MEIKNWEKEYEKRFTDFTTSALWYKTVKSFISNLLAQQKKEIGVSQWKEDGKKYGYWDYFKDEVKKEILEEVRKCVPRKRDEWYSDRGYHEMNGKNKCRQELLTNLNKLK
jgi:hypothetical protein